MQCVECYRTGNTKRFATTADERNVFMTWNRMAAKGHSLRLEHVTDMRRKAHSPKACVPANDLELAISLWEKEVLQFEEASGEIFPPALRTMHLTDMCISPPAKDQRFWRGSLRHLRSHQSRDP